MCLFVTRNWLQACFYTRTDAYCIVSVGFPCPLVQSCLYVQIHSKQSLHFRRSEPSVQMISQVANKPPPHHSLLIKQKHRQDLEPFFFYDIWLCFLYLALGVYNATFAFHVITERILQDLKIIFTYWSHMSFSVTCLFCFPFYLCVPFKRIPEDNGYMPVKLRSLRQVQKLQRLSWLRNSLEVGLFGQMAIFEPRWECCSAKITSSVLFAQSTRHVCRQEKEFFLGHCWHIPGRMFCYPLQLPWKEMLYCLDLK